MLVQQRFKSLENNFSIIIKYSKILLEFLLVLGNVVDIFKEFFLVWNSYLEFVFYVFFFMLELRSRG